MRKISQPAVTSAETLPGVTANGNVSADANDKELNTATADPGEIFRELWDINGPFEAQWMGALNGDTWQGDQRWRNDSTGWAFDSEVHVTNVNSVSDNRLDIRTPRLSDLRNIVTLVRACEPYLTAHSSYVFWINIQFFSETCAVAEMGGELVGWCSILPVPSGGYFLHQLGVAPSARRKGVAVSLVAQLLNRLKHQGTPFELAFTVDRKNKAALNLNKAIAERAGMQLLKKSGFIGVLEQESDEELYVMSLANSIQARRPVDRSSGTGAQ